MSESWANRERNTNRLVRAVTEYLFNRQDVTPNQLYGLCKLTWLTRNHEYLGTSYIKSTKLPALGEIFGRDFSRTTLTTVADEIASMSGVKEIKPLVLRATGFTNLYNAYRQSAKQWIHENSNQLIPLLRLAFSVQHDQERREVYRRMAKLPGVPRPNGNGGALPAQNLLTPVVFSLDSAIRCPLINGNVGITKLLAKLDGTRAPLEKQFTILVNLYGKAGVRDAADLDQVSGDPESLIELLCNESYKQLLETKPTKGKNLPLKDEQDVLAVYEARSVLGRRLHNVLTNKIKERLASYTLYEGVKQSAMFDVLVKNFDHAGTDLIIEIKNSLERSHLRMAIGQLYDYRFCAKTSAAVKLAILLPRRPGDDAIELLQSLHIGLLWLDGGLLVTQDEWLATLTRA